ncbi:hypothetical protein DPMN_034048 [Dreissena polymorpha]|uniref:Uncharacterized protein n=1 Tax=Dreissena polymorpha TaxID=45954 RepID=A0A9D4RLK4_DREPO|nr:hypothetical protein DPMN_034048 [Dreissena polymorpha]
MSKPGQLPSFDGYQRGSCKPNVLLLYSGSEESLSLVGKLLELLVNIFYHCCVRIDNSYADLSGNSAILGQGCSQVFEGDHFA